MAYRDYYRGAPTMGDMVNPRRRLMSPNDPRFAGGVNQTQTPPSGAAVPPPADPSTLDRWGRPPGHPQYGKPETAQDPDPARDAGPWSGGYRTQAQAQAQAPSKRSHAYTGSALAYYGTGDIDGSEDVAGGSHASTGVNTAGWTSGERGSRSIKNVSMKIATRYPPKPSSIDLWLADPDTKRFFPNAKKVGFDKIDFGDGKPVDVLKNADPASDSAEAWAFQAESESVPAGAGAGMTAASAAWNNQQPPAPGAPGDTSVSAGSRTGVTERGYVGPSFRDWVDGDWRAGRGER